MASRAEADTSHQSFSPRETSRGLSAFLRTHAAWGAWGQLASLQSAAFTGYALWLGIDEAGIARFVSFASLATLLQLVTSRYIVPRVRRPKGLILAFGVGHILFRFSIGIIPVYLAAQYRAPAISLLVLSGIGCWHLLAPIFSDWQSRLIPEDIRARFLGRQTVAHLLAGIVASYLAGLYLDRFPDGDARYPGFLTVFSVAAVLGLAGFVNLTRVSFGTMRATQTVGSFRAPFRDRAFRALLVFFLLWNFAHALSAPFYSVFMLKTLGISYTTIAILTSLHMGAMMLGSSFLGSLVDRFGSKPMLQILVPPMVLTPFFWIFNTPDNYVLIPVAMVLNGFLFSGILVAVNALLFGMVTEEGRDRASYFASWSSAVNVAYVVAPFVGSALVEALESVRFEALGYPIVNIQLIFGTSAVIMCLPVLLLRRVSDAKETTAGALLAQVGRGNLLAYVHSSMVYGRAASEGSRARAAGRMGRSRSPMALDTLIRALDDPSPEVRRQAARGLGDSRYADAVNPLVGELQNRESDIRSEAAEALGKIGDRAGVDPLIEAFYDPDTRVQISAIRALSEIGGEDINELLFWRFAEVDDPAIFPTLADVLGRTGDVRIVGPVLDRLQDYASSAIRLQLLNAVCRAAGDSENFYRLLSQDDLTRASQLDRLLAGTRRRLRRAHLVDDVARRELVRRIDELRSAIDEDQPDSQKSAAEAVLKVLRDHLDDRRMEHLSQRDAARLGAAALALTRLRTLGIDLPPDIHTLLLIVLLNALSAALVGETVAL